MDLGSLYFVSLAKTSCREMLLMTLNAPVTTWSAELLNVAIEIYLSIYWILPLTGLLKALKR
jgi:hypothetical protein